MQATDFPPLETPPPPPPPPPARSRNGLYIGIGIAIVLLICGALGVVGYIERDYLSRLLSTGVAYSNSSLGISLKYPQGWIFQEGSGTVAFASSQDAMSSSTSLTGAILEFGKFPITNTNFQSGVDPTSPESILNEVIKEDFTGVSTLEQVHGYKIGQYPIASTVLTVDAGGGVQAVTYLSVIVWKQNLIMVIGITTQPEWKQYRPVFDRVLHSMTLNF